MSIKIRKILLVLVAFCLIILTGCTTTNDIYNKSYDVNINIDNINEAFVPASEKAKAATVGVSLYTKTNIIRSWYLTATGSGVIYKGMAYLKDGSKVELAETKNRNDVDYYDYYVLTNAHVVNSNAANLDIKIYLSDIDTLVSGELLGMNAYEDLAVVHFFTSVYISPLTFAEEEVKVGEIVLAIGNPLGYDYAGTVTMGIISNVNRYLDVNRDINGDGKDDWEGTALVIQHDAAINSGNSGGALVNIKGELVGINAMKITDKAETVEGLGFAIPNKIINLTLDNMEKGIESKVNLLNKTVVYDVNDLLNRDVLQLDRLPDVDLSDLGYTYGAYIYMNNLGEYGLKSGDVVLKMNDETIYTAGMLDALLRSYDQDKLIWTVFRNGEIKEIEFSFK